MTFPQTMEGFHFSIWHGQLSIGPAKKGELARSVEEVESIQSLTGINPYEWLTLRIQCWY